MTTVVEAVASFAPSTNLGKRMEAAMQAAVLQAYADGITDPDIIRQRQIDAADAVKAAG